MRIFLFSLILLCSACGLLAADIQHPLDNLSESGADWGIWIDNGLVNPGETVRMTVSVPLEISSTNLPATLEIHARYLEDAQPVVEQIALKWKKNSKANRWQ